MSDFPPVFTQLDISATSITPGGAAPDPQTRHLLGESIALQQRQIELLDNAENFTDSEYALGEFIDRYGPRLAHFNGVLQLFAQLGAPPAPPPGEG